MTLKIDTEAHNNEKNVFFLQILLAKNCQTLIRLKRISRNGELLP